MTCLSELGCMLQCEVLAFYSLLLIWKTACDPGAKCGVFPFLKRDQRVQGGCCPQDMLLRERPHSAPRCFSQDPLVSLEGRVAGPGHTAGLWLAARPSCPPSSVKAAGFAP